MREDMTHVVIYCPVSSVKQLKKWGSLHSKGNPLARIYEAQRVLKGDDSLIDRPAMLKRLTNLQRTKDEGVIVIIGDLSRLAHKLIVSILVFPHALAHQAFRGHEGWQTSMKWRTRRDDSAYPWVSPYGLASLVQNCSKQFYRTGEFFLYGRLINKKGI